MSSIGKTVIAGAILGLLAAPSPRAFAATAAENACDFQPKFDTLRAIQVDGSLNYIDAIKAQLQVRKEILRSVIDCALSDVFTRQEELKSMPPEYQNSPAGQAVAKDLETSAQFYGEKKKNIDNLGIKGTQDLARDVAFWRSHNYKPITERQDNFLLWADNQSLFQKTASRFSQIRPAVISVTLIDNEDIKNDWQDAESKFQEAQDNNQKAESAIVNDPQNAMQFIKSSLEPLSEIYDKFMNISEKIKQSVP